MKTPIGQKEISGQSYYDVLPVKNPATGSNYQVIDLIHHLDLGFDLGSALKYLLRAGKKDPAKFEVDLRKAIQCIENEIRRRNSK